MENRLKKQEKTRKNNLACGKIILITTCHENRPMSRNVNYVTPAPLTL